MKYSKRKALFQRQYWAIKEEKTINEAIELIKAGFTLENAAQAIRNKLPFRSPLAIKSKIYRQQNGGIVYLPKNF